MRIIGGIYRHRNIEYPEDRTDIRPTKDRVREAIFSIIGDIDNYEVLDLYAGSGSMGLEAISRNANHVAFVDIALIAKNVVLKNISSLKIEKEKYDFYLKEDFDALETFKNENRCFDLVFLDPPYKSGKYEEAILYIKENNIIKQNGIIICESDRHINVGTDSFNKIKEYKYGDIIVTVMRNL